MKGKPGRPRKADNYTLKENDNHLATQHVPEFIFGARARKLAEMEADRAKWRLKCK